MQKKLSKYLAKFAKHSQKVPVDFLIILALIFIQNRFWLFKSIYDNFGSVMGSEGDSYYNLSLFMQNTLNFLKGDFYSLVGDHYTWYPNIIGLTAHVFAPSAIFGVLYSFIKNPVFIYNSIFFGNIILTQIGIYLLIKYYTKNKYISGFISLLFPLSQGTVWNFYTGHIHASLFWALPFLILLLEKIFEKKEISNRKLALHFTLSFITIFWTVFAEWHVLIFSSIWIGFWALFNFKRILKDFQFYKVRIFVVVAEFLIIFALLIPVGKGYLETSNFYDTSRSINDVAATNMDTVEYFGLKHLLVPLANIYERIGPSGALKDKIPELIANFKKSESGYPDLLSAFSFWLGMIVYLPWIVILIFRKGKFYLREFLYFTIFIFSSLIVLGPYPKALGNILESIKLPYYFIYKLVFPLSAIRAVWRAAAIGYMSLLIFWGLILKQIWKNVKRMEIYEQVARIGKLKYLLYAYCAFAGAFTLLIVGQGRTGASYQSTEKDNYIFSVFEASLEDKESVNFFVFTPEFENSYFNYQASLFNLEHRDKKVNWVAGGIAGHYPREANVLKEMVSNGEYPDIVSKLVSAKGTDVVIVEKKFDEKVLTSIYDSLEQYYLLREENESFVIWDLEDIAEVNTLEDINYHLSISKYQREGNNVELILSYENATKEMIIGGEDLDYTRLIVEFWQNDELRSSHEVELGQKPFLLPQMGFSRTLNFKSNLREGKGVVKLRDGEIYIQEIEVNILSSSEYRILLDEHEKDELGITPFDSKLPTYYMKETVFPLKLNFKIESGALQLSEIDLTAGFKSDDGKIYNGFPGWLNQPKYEIKGTYFPGDEIVVWGDAFLPYELRFYHIIPTVSEKMVY